MVYVTVYVCTRYRLVCICFPTPGRGLPYGSGLGLSRCLGPGECLHSFIHVCTVYIFIKLGPLLTDGGYPSKVLELGRIALKGLQWVEQRVGKAEGQERLTVRYTHLSCAAPAYACVCGCVTYAAVMQQGANAD